MFEFISILHSLFVLVFYAVLIMGPPASAVWFIVSLVRFIGSDRKNVIDHKKRRFSLVISSVLFLTIGLAIFAFVFFLSLAIPKM